MKAKKGQAAAAQAKGVFKGFSAGEKDLYRNVKQIRQHHEAEH